MSAGVTYREVKLRSCRVVHRNGFALVCWILQCFVMWGALRPILFLFFSYIYYYMNKERPMSEYKSSKGGVNMGEIVIIEVPQGNEVICE